MPRWMAPLLALVAINPAFPADEPKAVEPGPKMLHNFLLAEAQKFFDARREDLANVKSPEDVQKRQKALRARFLESLGEAPPTTPLNARIIGKIDGKEYTIEKVVFESRPDHHVTALFYLPKGKGPFPGVLLPCGHSVEGKANPIYQRACMLLALNGLAVLCYDPIGQGERVQLLDRMGKPAIAGSTSEHTMTGVGALLVGRQTATYRIVDGIRALDYLASRPEVDPKRLGCTGNSGGGTMTAYLMALDDRILAAAPSCYITSLERLFQTIGPQDAEQNITGQVAFGMEHADYVTMRAPKPTLICTGTQDYFDITGAWTSFREAKRAYGILGHGERVDLFEYDDKHGFSKPRREAAMRWMRRWLLDKDDAPTEPELTPLPVADLQVTRTGQVIEDYKGKSVFDLNAEAEKALVAKREKFLASDRKEIEKQMRRLLALAERVSAAPLRRKDATNWVFEPEQGIALPAQVFYQKDREPRVTYLILKCDDKEPKAGPDGTSTVVLSLRGMGETAPRKASPTGPNHFGVDSREAFLGLHLNRPLLGQRVVDVLSVVERLSAEKEFSHIHLVAPESAGPIALHAAFLDSRIEGVTISGSLATWSSVVRTPVSRNQLTNVVPGVLAYYDLPDVAALLAPRPLTINDPADAQGQPLSAAAAGKAFEKCSKAYQAKKAGEVFRLRTSDP